MSSDGTPWRPIVHGLDICQAIIAVLEAPIEAVANEVFNVGDTEHNYRVREIAEIVGRSSPDVPFRSAPRVPTTGAIAYRSRKSGNTCKPSSVSGTPGEELSNCSTCSNGSK
jgi:nucleoside-diphosphate-sugar epimerase